MGLKQRAGETFRWVRRRLYFDEGLPALEDPTKLLGGAVYGGADVRAVLKGGGLLAQRRRATLGPLLPATVSNSTMHLVLLPTHGRKIVKGI